MVGPWEGGQRFVAVKKTHPAKNPGFTALERPIQIVIPFSGNSLKWTKKEEHGSLSHYLKNSSPRCSATRTNLLPNDVPVSLSSLGPRILSRRRKALENPSGKRGRDDKGFLMEDRAAPKEETL